MNEHTPGPWNAIELDPDDPEWHAWEVWSDDTAISTMVTGKENARLIAAAPELLDALRLIIEEPNHKLLDTYRHLALEALAKAEGQPTETSS